MVCPITHGDHKQDENIYVRILPCRAVIKNPKGKNIMTCPLLWAATKIHAKP